MEINATGASAGSTAGANGFSQLSSEEFIKVLFTQLQSQDPLKPQDSGALLEQLSNLRNIESQMSLQTQLASLVTQNQVASASNLIGKQVQGLNEANDEVTGVVTSVRVKGDSVLLEMDTGQQLSMSRVTAIGGATVPTATGAAGAAGRPDAKLRDGHPEAFDPMPSRTAN